MAVRRRPPVSSGVGIKTKSTTDQIKDVLQNYPLGTNVLKELLQNGDDAKARYMTFLLDLRTHGDEKLSHPNLNVFQGPALLVFDSAVFPEKNFESMLKLQSSNKKFDPTKTGKFGVGSYSTYQITDVQSFVTENFIRFVDPQFSFCTKGETTEGLCSDLNDSDYHYTEECSDTCDGFCPGFEWCPPYDGKDFTFRKELFHPGSTYKYPGTILRLALRNRAMIEHSEKPLKDRISNQLLDPEKIEEILQNFSTEVVELMIFLRHVEEIRILIWRSNATAPDEISKVGIQNVTPELRQCRRIVNKYFEDNLGCDPEAPEDEVRPALFSMMQNHNSGNLQSEYRRICSSYEYLGSGSLFCAANFTLEIRSRLSGTSLQKWALAFRFAEPGSEAMKLCLKSVDPNDVLSHARLKFIPWAMVASLVEVDGRPAKIDIGRPYVTMPIGGLTTRLPLHINAGFELTLDRSSIFNTPNSEGNDRSRQLWNLALVSQLLPQVYVMMLKHLLLQPAGATFNLYDMFPPALESLGDIWGSIVDTRSSYTFYHLYANEKLLHPTGSITPNGPIELYSIDEAFFSDPQADRDVSDEIVRFMRSQGVKVVTPISSNGEPLLHIYKAFDMCVPRVRTLSPDTLCELLNSETIRRGLDVNSDPSLHHLCQTILRYFLKYSLSNPFSWIKLKGIPLLPLKNGTQGVLNPDPPYNFYIPKHEPEARVLDYAKHLVLDFRLEEDLEKTLCENTNVEIMTHIALSLLSDEFNPILCDKTVGFDAAKAIWHYLGCELEDKISKMKENTLRRSRSGDSTTPIPQSLERLPSGEIIVPCGEILEYFIGWRLFFNRRVEAFEIDDKSVHSVIRGSGLSKVVKTILESVGCQVVHKDIDSLLDRFIGIDGIYIHKASEQGVLDALQLRELSGLDAASRQELLVFFSRGLNVLRQDESNIEKLRSLALYKLNKVADDKAEIFTNLCSNLEDYLTYIGDPSDIHPLLCPSDRCLAPITEKNLKDLLEFIGVNVYPNTDQILMKFGFDRIRELKPDVLIDQMLKILKVVHEKPEAYRHKLASTAFVPLCVLQGIQGASTVLRAPAFDLKNPSSWILDPSEKRLRDLYEFDTDPFFPIPPYSEAQNLVSLRSLGIVSKLNRYGVINRATFISKQLSKPEIAISLATRLLEYLKDNDFLLIRNADSGDMSYEEFQRALLTIKWLPVDNAESPTSFLHIAPKRTSKGFMLNSASDMRPFIDAEAVCETMYLLNRNLEKGISTNMKSFFLWDSLPPLEFVIQQLNTLKDLYEEMRTENRYQVSQLLNDILRSQNGCYRTLIKYTNDETQKSKMKYDLNNIDCWIFHAQYHEWISPLRCAYNCKSDLPPYLCKLPASFQDMRVLTDCFGVRDEFTENSYAESLDAIGKSHTSVELSQDQLGHVIMALREIVSFGKKEENLEWWTQTKMKIMLPTTEMLMAPPESIYYVDNQRLFQEVSHKDMKISHMEVPPYIASAFDVRPFSSCLSVDDDDVDDDIGQKVDLCSILRTNLENYPQGSVLKEMLQNADDAGARSFVVMYDKRYHPVDALPAYRVDALMKHELQGPAILVYNDGMMKEKDITAIQNISQSSKSEDHSKIGKFGLGFNSVYHITDIPSFLTGNSLFIFDPSQNYLHCDRKGRGKFGSKFNLKDFDKLQDLFLPFATTESDPRFDFLFSPSKDKISYDGTLFRLPLRTLKQISVSKLGRPQFTDECALNLVRDLQSNISNVSLFLKNIQEVKILVWEHGESQPSILSHCKVNDSDQEAAFQIPRLLKRDKNGLIEDIKEGKVYVSTWEREMVITSDISEQSTSFRFLMSSRFGTDRHHVEMHKHITDNADCRFLPIAGVAALIDTNLMCPPEQYAKSIAGMTFCFLPLPLRTDFPVQINAFFAISTERQSINNKEKKYCDWNAMLRELVVAPLYAHLLFEARNRFNLESYYKLFPRTIQISGLDPFFDSMAKETYRSIIRSEYPVFALKVNADSTEGQVWSKLQDVIFCPEQKELSFNAFEIVQSILIADHFRLTYAPSFVSKECEAVVGELVKNCSPVTVKEFYASKWRDDFQTKSFCRQGESKLHSLASKKTVNDMLLYILHDKNQFSKQGELAKILEDAPFLSLASGALGIFKRAEFRISVPTSFLSLLPECLDSCICEEELSLLSNYPNWTTELNIPKLDLEILSKKCVDGAPRELKIAFESQNPFLDITDLSKDRKKYIIDWLHKFYEFLSTVPQLDEKKFVSLFSKWPILLAQVDKRIRLFKVLHGKLVLSCNIQGTSGFEEERSILHDKLKCPVLKFIEFIPPSVCMFMNTLVSQVKCMDILHLIQNGCDSSTRGISSLPGRDRETLLQACIKTQPEDRSVKSSFVELVKKFPFFKKSDGEFSAIDKGSWYLIPLEDLPIALEGNFLEASNKKLFSFYSETLGIPGLTLKECYLQFILPTLRDLSDSDLNKVMSHLKENQDLTKEPLMVDILCSSPCILIRNHRLRPAECFDPRNILFKHFLGHKCLPPNHPYASEDWLVFLKKIGLRTDLSLRSSNITSDVLSADEILISIARAIERAAQDQELARGAIVGVRRHQSYDIKKATIVKFDKVDCTVQFISSKKKSEVVKVSTELVISPWSDDAMSESICDFSKISWNDRDSEVYNNVLRPVVEGIFSFLAELNKAFDDRQISPEALRVISKISCIPLFWKDFVRREGRAFGNPSEIATDEVASLVQSIYPTYFGAKCGLWGKIETALRKLWTGSFSPGLEKALEMKSEVLTKDVLSHIKFLVMGPVRAISVHLNTFDINLDAQDLATLIFKNYQDNLIQLQTRQQDYPTIAQELRKFPFVWIFSTTFRSSRLMDCENSFFDLEQSLVGSPYSNIAPEDSTKPGYASSIPLRLSKDLRPFLMAMGARDLPTKETLLNYLTRLKEDCKKVIKVGENEKLLYEAEEVYQMATTILKVLSFLAPNEVLPSTVWLPTDPALSAVVDSYWYFNAPKSPENWFRPASELVSVDDKPIYKELALLNFEEIRFLKLDERFRDSKTSIMKILPLKSLSQVIIMEPRQSVLKIIPDDEFNRINALFQRPEFLRALFYIKMYDAIVQSHRYDPSGEVYLRLQHKKWTAKDVYVMVPSWLPSRIALTEKIEVSFLLSLAGKRVDVTSNRFYRTDPVYVDKHGVKKYEKGNSIQVEFFKFSEGKRGEAIQLEPKVKKLYIRNIQDDLVICQSFFASEESSQMLCFQNPTIICSEGSRQLKIMSHKETVLYIGKPENASDDIVREISLALDEEFRGLREPIPDFPIVSFTESYGKNVLTFLDLLKLSPDDSEGFSNLLEKLRRESFIRIVEQQVGDTLSDREINELYFPRDPKEEIRFKKNELVAFRDECDGSKDLKYARVHEVRDEVIVLLISEDLQTSRTFKKSQNLHEVVFKFQREYEQMLKELAAERSTKVFTRTMTKLLSEEPVGDCGVDELSSFLKLLEDLYKEGEVLHEQGLLVDPTILQRLYAIIDSSKAKLSSLQKRHQTTDDTQVPPPPPPPLPAKQSSPSKPPALHDEECPQPQVSPKVDEKFKIKEIGGKEVGALEGIAKKANAGLGSNEMMNFDDLLNVLGGISGTNAKSDCNGGNGVFTGIGDISGDLLTQLMDILRGDIGGDQSGVGDAGIGGGSIGGDGSIGGGGGNSKGGEKGKTLRGKALDDLLEQTEKNCHDSTLRKIDKTTGKRTDGGGSKSSNCSDEDFHIKKTNISYHGMEFWINEQMSIENLPREIESSSDIFSVILMFIRYKAFPDVPAAALKLFYDPTSSKMAFNISQGTLFFNIHYWLEFGHVINDVSTLYFWFNVFCHEVAHNEEHDHGERHNYIHHMLATKKMGLLFSANSSVVDASGKQ